MKGFLLFLSIIATVLVGGCATAFVEAKPEEIADPQSSLVFGYMDMGGAQANMDYFDMKRTDAGYQSIYFKTEKGLFFHRGVPIGTFQLDEFGGHSKAFIVLFGSDYHRFNFMNPEAVFRLATPGMYFLGSFKYIKDKDNFDVVRVDSPTEADLLQQLLPHVRGTKWEEKVLNRLRMLGAIMPK